MAWIPNLTLELIDNTSPETTCVYGGGQYGVPEPSYGQCPSVLDTEPPYLRNLDPLADAIDVNRFTSVSMEIVDDDCGVNFATVIITIGGLLAWIHDTVQLGFSGTRSTVSNGYRYVLTPSESFEPRQLIEVHVVASDFFDLTMDETYSFTTSGGIAPPFLRNTNPFPSQTGVSLLPTISADILDDEGVVVSTIDAYVDGALAYDGVAAVFVAPFSGSLVPTTVDGYSGYHIVLLRSTPFSATTIVEVRIVAKDPDAMVMDETWQFQTASVLLRLDQGLYEIALEATFSGPMLLSTLLDASSYQLSNGAYIRHVEPLPVNSLVPTSVRLWVEGLQNNIAFVLTILSPPVMDASGNPLASQGRTATLIPFQSSAFFSNTTGLVRSWHESRLVLKDSQRAYLVGTRGLDAFDITNSIGRSVKWSQVLDAYGTVAACLSGGSDYIFSDIIPPSLGGRSPAPGATGVSRNTHIYLSIADKTTSVEVAQLTIYLRNAGIPTGEKRVFSGVNGWEVPEVCGGLISVQRQILNVHLIPKQPLIDGPTTVSVIAVDLVGNLLSTSYTFTVGGGPVVEGGFGDEAFGVDSFGI